MNVKPGDFAVIIADPETRVDGQSNVGKKVHVMEAPKIRSFNEHLMQKHYGTIWLVQPLQPLYVVHILNMRAPKRYLDMKMRRLVLPDSLLRRIDPPADTEETFTGNSTDADQQERLLSELRKVHKELNHAPW
jgi:hypothetical protein